ncbi:MAG: hypothetical protein ACREVR_14305 [Burkholderiales bacterium]
MPPGGPPRSAPAASLYAQRLLYPNAGCALDAPGSRDQRYVERMLNLLEGLRPGVKLVLLPFDRNSMSRLTELGVIELRLAPVLSAVREHNPLLFDFVLKRHLHEVVVSWMRAADVMLLS